MKPLLTIDHLIREAKIFCDFMSQENHPELVGVTDGKAVGTYVEHRFQRYLSERYTVRIGSSAKGIDLPGENIQTDIKVTPLPSRNQVARSKMPARKYMAWDIISWSLYMINTM